MKLDDLIDKLQDIRKNKLNDFAQVYAIKDDGEELYFEIEDINYASDEGFLIKIEPKGLDYDINDIECIQESVKDANDSIDEALWHLKHVLKKLKGN
jgi:regulator of sigma D